MPTGDDYVDTREGWREVPHPKLPPDNTRKLVEEDENGYVTRVWVREEPVPPLPTEPNTHIAADGREWILRNEGCQWVSLYDRHLRLAPEQLAERITGFEVLARPVVAGGIALAAVRRETAKAVADFAEEVEGPYVAHRIRVEFGVES